MEKLQSGIDFLRKEVTALKPQKVTNKSTKTPVDKKRKQTEGKKLDFNAVTYLQKYGDDKLQEELKNKDGEELQQIIRSERIKIGKDSKTFEREDMIKEIVLNAKRRLKRGSAFLKD